MILRVVVGLIFLTSGNVARAVTASSANDICAPTADPCLVNDTFTIVSGSVLDFGTRALVFPGGSGKKLELESGTGLRSMSIRAGSIQIEAGSAIIGKGGIVDIRTIGDVVVRRSGSTRARIDVSDQIFPGDLTIETTGPDGDVVIEGTITAQGTGIDAGSGTIDITASYMTSGGDVVVQGDLLAGGGGNAIGGDVSITASGSVTSTGTIDTSAADGGDILIFAEQGVSITASGTAKLVTQGTNVGGDAGDIDVQSMDGDVLISQPIVATGAPEIDFAGSGGTVTIIADQGSVTLAGPVSLSGAVPDGDGGEVSITAALDITHTGPITALGRTAFGTGGFVDFTAQRDVTVGSIDVTGDCLECGGGDVDVLGFCHVELPAGVGILDNGVAGNVRLSTGGTMRIAGTITASGRVDLTRRDQSMPPDLTGSVITPAPLLLVNLALPQCGCTLGACGNGELNCGEVCDDGNTVNDATCTANCKRVPACGDGQMDTFIGESCDDGNKVDCDDCSRTCQVEACGNGVPECDEECDEGGVATETCQADCRLPPPPGCGDGVLDELTEECDDSNLTDCDGCNHLCVVEACGNGITECAEDCDDFGTDACDGCSPTCKFEACGNGVQDCGEECDDGPANGQPGSECLAEVCRIGSVCQAGGPALCIPCGSDQDCDLCAGMICNAEGVCVAGTLDCDDENPCTLDGCSALSGCTHELLNGADVPECDDGKACTIPECTETGCVQRELGDFEGVTCHFTTLDELFDDAGIDERARTILTKLRTKAAALVSKAAEGEELGKSKRVKKGLKKARGRMNKMRKKVVKLTGKRITLDAAALLTDEIDEAIVDIEDLLASFGFPV